jgi:hypothetical protein
VIEAGFLRLYNAGNPAADFFPFGPGDGILSFHDLSVFVTLFGEPYEI